MTFIVDPVGVSTTAMDASSASGSVAGPAVGSGFGSAAGSSTNNDSCMTSGSVAAWSGDSSSESWVKVTFEFPSWALPLL
ncbi:MAG: hypothetical protein M9906_10605 [Microthrixaceae bacterium]|nr:hypothetical protein [Microthrixaceae bacterium]